MGRRSGSTLDEQAERRRSRQRNLATILLLVGLGLVLAAIAIIYFREDDENGSQPVLPTSVPGRNELAHVADALRRQGLDVSYGPRGIRSPILSEPGQNLTVDGATLYVFIYDTVPLRESQFDEARGNPVAILPRGPGTPASDPPFLAAGSNVMVALVNGSAEIAEKVDRAISGLN
jgi:hypothetical protein